MELDGPQLAVTLTGEFADATLVSDHGTVDMAGSATGARPEPGGLLPRRVGGPRLHPPRPGAPGHLPPAARPGRRSTRPCARGTRVRRPGPDSRLRRAPRRPGRSASRRARGGRPLPAAGPRRARPGQPAPAPGGVPRCTRPRGRRPPRLRRRPGRDAALARRAPLRRAPRPRRRPGPGQPGVVRRPRRRALRQPRRRARGPGSSPAPGNAGCAPCPDTPTARSGPRPGGASG